MSHGYALFEFFLMSLIKHHIFTLVTHEGEYVSFLADDAMDAAFKAQDFCAQHNTILMDVINGQKEGVLS